jgi:hypothetical protein
MLSHQQIAKISIIKDVIEITEIKKEEQCELYAGGEDDGYHSYGNDWWTNINCPYSYKYLSIDSLYPAKYFQGVGHPDDTVSSQIYQYMQVIFRGIFGRPFNSVIEFGTGGGEITAQFAHHGIDYIAVEGTHAGVDQLMANKIPPERIIQSNLKFFKGLGRMFDIAMCTEVAEHIEPFFASKIVDNCITHAEAVWFSCADRNRRAHYHHINEQDIEVWDNLFAHMGFPFYVALNNMYNRASRLYLSERIGIEFKNKRA